MWLKKYNVKFRVSFGKQSSSFFIMIFETLLRIIRNADIEIIV